MQLLAWLGLEKRLPSKERRFSTAAVSMRRMVRGSQIS